MMSSGVARWRAISDGWTKIDAPMIVPTTIATALVRVSAGDSWATPVILLGQELTRWIRFLTPRGAMRHSIASRVCGGGARSVARRQISCGSFRARSSGSSSAAGEALTVGSDRSIWRADGPPLPPELVESYFRYYIYYAQPRAARGWPRCSCDDPLARLCVARHSVRASYRDGHPDARALSDPAVLSAVVMAVCKVSRGPIRASSGQMPWRSSPSMRGSSSGAVGFVRARDARRAHGTISHLSFEIGIFMRLRSHAVLLFSSSASSCRCRRSRRRR